MSMTIKPSLDMGVLRAVNGSRCERWHEGAEPWVISDWSNAMAGEAGEFCNVVKKIRRLQTGTIGNRDDPKLPQLVHAAGLEAADTLIYLDLAMSKLGLDLGAYTVTKFNEVSEREGFEERLWLPTQK